MPSAPWLAVALGLSQSGAGISHEPIGCVAPGQYPVVQAFVEPADEVRSVKIYFRSDKYPKFYYVGMTAEGGAFTGTLPRPSAETERIVYYIESIDNTFTGRVGEEHVFEVRPDCTRSGDDGGEPAGPPPRITVGAVESGIPAIPPGFDTAGIVGTIASTGALMGLAGGSGIGTAGVVGAAAAAGAGGAVVVATASGGEEQATPQERVEPPPAPPPGPPPPPPQPTPTPAPNPPGPPAPAPTPPPPAPTPPAPAPPPTTPPPPAPTPPPPPAPPPPDPTPPPPPPPPPPPTPSPVEACFTASFPGKSCNLKLDGRCSRGEIRSWDWTIDVPPQLGGSSTHSGRMVNRNFPHCSGESVQVSLTVTGEGGARSSTSRAIQLPMKLSWELEEPVDCAVTSLLSPSGASGQVVFDGARSETVQGAVPQLHQLRQLATERELEAVVVTPAGEGLWSFDFARCRDLVRGSLAPTGGEVLSSGPDRIVFRVAGASGERMALRYRLSP